MLWEVFARMFASYGPQGWWPVTLRAGREPVYRPGVYTPRRESERHEIAFGAVLAQNTAWGNARKALMALSAAGIRTPEDMVAVPMARLQTLIRPSGYFRQKAARLKTLAAFLRETRHQTQSTAALRGALLGLNGIGPETADSILLYAWERPVFVVDAYACRLLVRLGICARSPAYAEASRVFEGVLEPRVALCNEYHALIVRHAVAHCRSRPACAGCPVRTLCRAACAGS